MDVMGTFSEHIEGAQKIFKSNAKDLSEVHASLRRHRCHLDQDRDEMIKITEQLGVLGRQQRRLAEHVSMLQDVCDHQDEMITTQKAEISQL